MNSPNVPPPMFLMHAELKKYVIVREVPDIGSKSPSELASLSQVSCRALGQVGHDQVQWQHSYVTGNK